MARPVYHRVEVRVVIADGAEGRGPWLGLFAGSRAARERLEGEAWETATRAIAAYREWFNDHLPSPNFDRAEAIFWFKAEGEPFLFGACAYAAALMSLGCEARLVRCHEPGPCAYADRWQVAAAWPTGRRQGPLEVDRFGGPAAVQALAARWVPAPAPTVAS